MSLAESTRPEPLTEAEKLSIINFDQTHSDKDWELLKLSVAASIASGHVETPVCQVFSGGLEGGVPPDVVNRSIARIALPTEVKDDQRVTRARVGPRARERHQPERTVSAIDIGPRNDLGRARARSRLPAARFVTHEACVEFGSAMTAIGAPAGVERIAMLTAE